MSADLKLLGIRKDLTNKTYGKLVALYFLKRDDHGNAIWLCRCKCGRTLSVRGSSLTSGNTSSCGCQQGNRVKSANRKGKHAERGVIPGLEDNQIIILRTHGSDPASRTCDCGFAFIFGDRVKAFTGSFMALEPKFRQKLMGPLDILTYRALKILESNGIIDAQGERTANKWMEDNNVSSVCKRTVGGYDLIEKFYKDDRNEYQQQP